MALEPSQIEPVAVSIVRLTALPDWKRRISDLDPIFFEASLTKAFAGEDARSAFRERWLGRFLDNWPELAIVALERTRLIGYIVGTHADPALNPMFDDIGYYRELAHLTSTFPAHLHINLASEGRNRGVGSRLIKAFVDEARDAGLPGVHLVTGRDSHNRSFYAKNGFRCCAELLWGGMPIVMLGHET